MKSDICYVILVCVYVRLYIGASSVCGHPAWGSAECPLSPQGSPYPCASGAIQHQSSYPGSVLWPHHLGQRLAGLCTWLVGKERAQVSTYTPHKKVGDIRLSKSKKFMLQDIIS